MPKKTVFNIGKKGQALVFAYLVISAFIVFSAGLLMKAAQEKNESERNKLTTETLYLAEGANEYTIKKFITDMANFVIPRDTSSFSATTTYSEFGGASVNTTITALESTDRQITEGFIKVFIRNYEAVSTATHPDNNTIRVTIHQIFSRRLIPTFQHAVFYNDDLEMLPGPNMTLSGRIHSNKDIYLDSENTLTINSDYLRCAGEIYNHRKDSGIIPPGDVNILVSGSSPAAYQTMNGFDSDDPNWTTDALTKWNGTVQSAVHGVTELTVPAVGSIQPTGYYASKADVVITNNTIIKGGVTLVEGVDYPAGTITTTSTSFYNNREGKYIKMTTVDLEKLSGNSGTCSGGACPNNLPTNGLLYATRNDAGTDEPGIRLSNGSEINNTTGLTVVSNDPVYIQGNYNTTNKKPASVICDSLNLLSNNWNDSNSTLSVNSRTANNTTFNCAFVAGIDETATGNYNGGLENYPRLHENWSSRSLNIKGSFVALWNSAVATGAWVYGNPQYTAPVRNWDYDPDFNDISKLPPFTPMAIEARRIVWWTE